MSQQPNPQQSNPQPRTMPNGDVLYYNLVNSQMIFHNVDGPAIIRGDGTREWWMNGERHREGGPAVEYSNGDYEWWVRGKLHREGGPALLHKNSLEEWRINGEYYRADGPAHIIKGAESIHPNGIRFDNLSKERQRNIGKMIIEEWYPEKGKGLHRDAGPALKKVIGNELEYEWWQNGKCVTLLAHNIVPSKKKDIVDWHFICTSIC
jgi:hypothetical protein